MTLKATPKVIPAKRRKVTVRTRNSRITINIKEKIQQRQRGNGLAANTMTVIVQEVRKTTLDLLEPIMIGNESKNHLVKSMTEDEVTMTVGLGRRSSVTTFLEVKNQAVIHIEKGRGGEAAVAAQGVDEFMIRRPGNVFLRYKLPLSIVMIPHFRC
jgi:hypothetical protein